MKVLSEEISLHGKSEEITIFQTPGEINGCCPQADALEL